MGTTMEVETTNGTNGQGTEQEFKGFAEYKLAGDVPEQLRGKLVRTREFRDLVDFKSGVQDGEDKHITKLAQAQYDIIVQRKIREAVQNAAEEAQSTEPDDKISEAAQNIRVGDWDAVLVFAQDIADAFVYGSRPAGTGESTKARRAVKTVDTLTTAAANDPELARKLAELGISLG